MVVVPTALFAFFYEPGLADSIMLNEEIVGYFVDKWCAVVEIFNHGEDMIEICFGQGYHLDRDVVGFGFHIWVRRF